MALSQAQQYLRFIREKRSSTYVTSLRTNSDGKRIGKLSFGTATTDSSAAAKESLADAIADEIIDRERRINSLDKALKGAIKQARAIDTGALQKSVRTELKRVTAGRADAVAEKARKIEQIGRSAAVSKTIGALSKSQEKSADFVARQVASELKRREKILNTMDSELSKDQLAQNAVFEIDVYAEDYYNFMDEGLEPGDRAGWISATGGVNGRESSFRGLMSWVQRNPLKFREIGANDISDAAAAAIAANIMRKWLKEGYKGRNFTETGVRSWRQRLDKALRSDALIQRAVVKSGVLSGSTSIAANMAAFLVDQVAVGFVNGVNFSADLLMASAKAQADSIGMLRASMPEVLPEVELEAKALELRDKIVKEQIKRNKIT